MADQFHSLGDGKRMRYAVFDPATLPHATIVIAPGRREFIEKKYAEVGHDFTQRGFRVIIFDRRGQGLSDRVLNGQNRQRDHIVDFDIFLNDFTSFYHAVIKPLQAGPLVLHGHSMGGHLVLRWLAEHNEVAADAVILTSPMLALASLPVHLATHAVSWIETKLGNGENYATNQHDFDHEDKIFLHNPLTHDPERFAIIEKYFTENPDLVVGGVTWDWLNAALRSIHTLQRRSYLNRIKTPTLTLMGSKDRVTPPSEVEHYLSYLQHEKHVIISGALHDVMNEANIYRLEAWQHIDSFLKAVIPV